MWARLWLEKAVRAGDKRPRSRSLRFTCRQGVPQEVDRAQGLIAGGCRSRFCAGCTATGPICIRASSIGPVDVEEATRWYRIGAEAGDAELQYRLALMLRAGKGAAKSQAEAIERLRRAAGNGKREATFELGVACCTGDGTLSDIAQGARLYAAAATAGHPVAMFNWGVMLRNGVGIEANEEEWTNMDREGGEGGLEGRSLGFGARDMSALRPSSPNPFASDPAVARRGRGGPFGRSRLVDGDLLVVEGWAIGGQDLTFIAVGGRRSNVPFADILRQRRRRRRVQRRSRSRRKDSWQSGGSVRAATCRCDCEQAPGSRWRSM